MSVFCWIATIICLTGTVINVKRINYCFYFWMIGEIMWLSYDLRQYMVSRAILDFVGLVLAVWGIKENCLKSGE